MSKSVVLSTATALLLATGSAHAFSVGTGAGASVSLPGASIQLEGKTAADAQKAAEAAAAAKASKEQAAATAAAAKQAAADQAAAAKTAATAQANASAKVQASANASATAQANANANAKFAATDRAALRAYQASKAKSEGQAGFFSAIASRFSSTLPSGWKRDLKVGAKLDADIAAAGTKVDTSAAVGFGPKVDGSQVIIVQDRAILVDSKSSVVLDVIKL